MKITRKKLFKIINEEIGKVAVQTRLRGQHDRDAFASGIFEDEEDDRGERSVKYKADKNKKVTKMDFLPSKVLKKIAKEKDSKKENEELSEKKKKKAKLTPGYKANRSKADQERLAALTQQYKDAKKTTGKADDLAAIKARDSFEKTQKNTGKKSQYNYAESLNDLSEDDQRLVIAELMDEAANELLEKKKVSKKVHNSLKKKAKDRNAPLGALKAIYRKGMGAFYSSGSRSGQNPHSWAMGRVNSVLRGGKARSVDAAQWKQIQKHRKKKRKKK